MIIDFIFLAFAMVLLVAMAGAFRALRRLPYPLSDFLQASRRITAGLTRLAARQENASFILERGVLRSECRAIQSDMLYATSFILEQAGHAARWYEKHRPGDTKVSEETGDILRNAVSLMLHLQWAGLQLALSTSPARSACSTLEAGRRFATVYEGFLVMLQGHQQPAAPDARREASPAREGWVNVADIDERRSCAR